jgi:hypothetical protein
MKILAIAVTSIAFAVGAVVTYLVVRLFQSDMTFLSLMVGAIVGSQGGLIISHRQPGATLTSQLKLRLGIVVAITGVALSLILQATIHWFRFPEVSIPIGAVGCFVFPLVLSDTLWKALEKGKKNG